MNVSDAKDKIEWQKHHIVPKHAGGGDGADNLIKVNTSLHAFLHQLRFDELGEEFDNIAARCLRGQIGHREAIIEASHEGMRKRRKDNPEWAALVNAKISKALMGKPSPKPEDTSNYKAAAIRDKTYLRMKGTWGHRKGFAPSNKGERSHQYNHTEVKLMRDKEMSWTTISRLVGIPRTTLQRYYEGEL